MDQNKVLLRSKELRSFIPQTQLYSRANLKKILNKFKMVYVKPVHGSFGQGVMRVEQMEHNGKMVYRYQLGRKPRTFGTYRELFASIDRNKLKRKYLAQQGIPLLTYKARPFDVRVMVQRSPKRPWETTGCIGRLAHPKKVVTNFHSQGTPLPVELLMRSYLRERSPRQYTEVLQKLGVKIAEHLHNSYPGFREIGVDVGIDRKLHPWVLEVNTAPDPFIFNQLKDKTMFRTVIRYARANGRFVKRIRKAKRSIRG